MQEIWRWIDRTNTSMNCRLNRDYNHLHDEPAVHGRLPVGRVPGGGHLRPRPHHGLVVVDAEGRAAHGRHVESLERLHAQQLGITWI